MSDRSTRSSTRSKASTGQSNGELARGRVDEQLGDLEFSDWYESPVFEQSSEERFEAMATSGRAPARLLARVVIAAGAKRDRNRGSRNGPVDLPEQKGEPVNRLAEDVTAEPADAEPEPIEASDEDTEFAMPEAQAEPIKVLDEEPEALAEDDETDYHEEEEEEEEEEPEAEALAEAADPEAAEPDAAELEPNAIEPGAPEPLLIPELAERMSFRQKASALLDRWAEKEVAMATRLDDALVPSISWGSRKKPAHARRNKSG